MQANPNIRAIAARVLADVVRRGQSLSAVLPPALEKIAKPTDRALLQEICYGVLRWHLRLKALSGKLMRKPFKEKDSDIACLVWIGLYQLIYMRMPDYAAVTETVNAARTLKKPWAASLINGILRNFSRSQEQLLRQVDEDVQAALAHPAWFLQCIQHDWPEQWQQVAEANNTRAPMTLRVNEGHQSREAYVQRLQQAEIGHSVARHAGCGVVLEQPVNVERLPGFSEGDVSVQDEAAQLAAILLDVQPGMRVLDACAAPGGKSAHILEHQPQLQELVALDIDAQRLQRVTETLQRIGVQARVLEGDAVASEQWWDGKPFDRILLDAPCSATGVIRRHPDIKLLRRAQDIDDLAQRQAQILEALWPLLARGGMLLYATCSVMERENALQVASFIKGHADAQELVLDAAWGMAREVGRQILPGQDNMDGFYYACVQKRTTDRT
jgi:16S rRNA (cytosine967-C5)-methyltransferase